MIATAPSLKRILDADLCSGCGLCASLSDGAITMSMTDEGYLRPSQNAPVPADTDVLVAAICPGIRLVQDSREGERHTLWGPIVSSRIGAATDPALRHHASSGGALSAILNHLHETGTVDRVLQTSASDAAPLENVSVLSLDSRDVHRAAGSRYAPSAPLSGLIAELGRPGRFALVGKPCDIAAARALARYDKRVNEKIPVMLSFFCAGVPSITGAKAILANLGVAEADVVRFRYRGDGWPGRATATLRDGREVGMSYAASWGDILSKHVQFRCKICPDGSGGFADIVGADAWHSDDKGYPMFEEDEGRSLILTRTTLGETLVGAAIAGNRLTAQPLRVAEIARMQPSQANRKRLVFSRLLAMALFGHRVPKYWGLDLFCAARSAGSYGSVKSFLGMARRILRHARRANS